MTKPLPTWYDGRDPKCPYCAKLSDLINSTIGADERAKLQALYGQHRTIHLEEWRKSPMVIPVFTLHSRN